MIHIPKHIALIMDGNRRWAKKHNLPVLEGHRHGEKTIEPLVDEAIKRGIKYLTFWAFSTENWHRSSREVSVLLTLFRSLLNKRADKYHLKNVRLNFLGDLSKFPRDIQKKTESWAQKTKNNTSITVNLALNYGGRDEIIRAIAKWRSNSVFNPPAGGQNSELTIEDFNNYLDTAGQPDPDLLIRTGGEKRLSGFLLWQLEYTELYFSETLWPDFTPFELLKALNEYKIRQRRFGR